MWKNVISWSCCSCYFRASSHLDNSYNHVKKRFFGFFHKFLFNILECKLKFDMAMFYNQSSMWNVETCD